MKESKKMDAVQKTVCALYLYKPQENSDETCSICHEPLDPSKLIVAHLTPEEQVDLDQAREELNTLEEKVHLGQLTQEQKVIQAAAYQTLRTVTQGASQHPTHLECNNNWTATQLKGKKNTVNCQVCGQEYYQPTIEDASYCADPHVLQTYLDAKDFNNRQDVIETIDGIVCMSHHLPEHGEIIKKLLSALRLPLPKHKSIEFIEKAIFAGNVEMIETLCETGQFTSEEKDNYIAKANEVHDKDPEQLATERFKEMIAKIPVELAQDLLNNSDFADKEAFIQGILASDREDLKALGVNK